MSRDKVSDEYTVKDRLNHAYILAAQLITIEKSTTFSEDTRESRREIREGILTLVDLIPTEWKELDKSWNEDFEDAKIKTKVDMRPIVAGLTRMSAETCEKLGIPAFKEIIDFNYHKLLQAAVDVLNRRRMLARRDYIQELEKLEFYDTEIPK